MINLFSSKLKGRSFPTGFWSKFSFLFTITLLLFSAKCEDEMTFELGETFEMKAGEIVQIKGEKYGMLFLDVKEDSRCPKGANCIWEGHAVIQLSTRNQGKTENLEMTLRAGNSTLSMGTSAPYQLTLVDVIPYPEIGMDVAENEYTIKLQVNKQEQTK